MNRNCQLVSGEYMHSLSIGNRVRIDPGKTHGSNALRTFERSGSTTRRGIASVLAVLTASALAFLGGQVPAQAAAPATSTAGTAATPAATTAGASSAPSGSTGYEPVCPTSTKGQMTCFALRRTGLKQVKGLQVNAAAPSGYGPSDLQSAYSLPADGGEGQTIAIVDGYDDPNAESDLAVYRQQYGLPACTTANGCFSKIDQRGGTGYPAPDPDWAGEISLDLDMVSAVSPDAHILLVEADDSSLANLGAAVDEAVALGAKFVSNSYGSNYSAGSGEDPTDPAAYDGYFDHPGIAVVAAAGDYGYGVSYPASSPYVTAVGGTSLVRDSNATRGWSESVWNDTGSGCSLYEPKPAFQTDTGCSMRSVSDVSAAADPAHGLAVYQTYGAAGWNVYGGTSAASPIIAGVYADAGAPAANTYPNSYPYAAGGTGLNDVTAGNDGSCDPTYLCNAGVGYDGPTGLGTPNGLSAFRTGPHGQLTGTVTDSATGKPLAGASVTAAQGLSTTTDANGSYTLALPVGSYHLAVDSYGYAPAGASVSIADSATVTQSFSLSPVPSRTVSGTVTDGSGHDWPLYAEITVSGVPGAPVWTNPTTGDYTLSLPEDHTYTLHVTSAYAGYQSLTKTVTVGSQAQTLNLPVQANAWSGTTPGYSVKLTGTTETFDSTTSAPQGWSVVNAPGTTGGWAFDDPGNRGNITGGTGGFASEDNFGTVQDSQLISPVYDFSSMKDPELAFDTQYQGQGGQTAEVDVSTDGGTTWTSAWTQTSDIGPSTIEIPLSAYAGAPSVQVRFHLTSPFDTKWLLDNVFVGERDLSVIPGGLLTGIVKDGNTSAGLVGATVTSTQQPAVTATTVATPNDPDLGNGFYSLFSPATGKQTFTVTKWNYATLTRMENVTGNADVDAPFVLQAGRLVTTSKVDATVTLGGRTIRTVTVKNTGRVAATVNLGEQPGGFSPSAAGNTSVPTKLVKGDFSLLADKPQAGGTAATTVQPSDGTDTAWQAAPSLPVPTQDNAVDSYAGKVYSSFGFNGSASSNALYVMNPATGIWSQLASAADVRQDPAHGFIDGKLYAVGGWGSDGTPDAKLEIYDPASNSWSTGASSPHPFAAPGSAVLDGKLYVVGGCSVTGCATTNVSVYDPSTNSWSQAAPYPSAIAWNSCAGISGELYCTGGTVLRNLETTYTYKYDPTANTWTRLANMPEALASSAYTTANGQLLVAGGYINNNAITNQAYSFDPTTGTWTALPNLNTPVYREGAAPGLYVVGGASGLNTPSTSVEELQGWDQEATQDVTWLGEGKQQLTVPPGESRTVILTLDASVPAVTQAGYYSALLTLNSDTPYPLLPVALTLHVKSRPPTLSGRTSALTTD
jgi:N-acetylneuraminic acid mutarotase